MLNISDYVVHSGHGVCEIIDKKFNENMNKMFYCLKTKSNNMTIMVPEDKAHSLLRNITDKPHALAIIDNVINMEVNYSKDNKERKNNFQALLSSNNLSDTLFLLKNLYYLSDDKKKEKKTLGSFDTQFLQQAYRKTIDELILSLEITKDEADTIITKFKPQQ